MKRNKPQESIIQTKRLILRQWKDEDLEPFAQLNADPRVMEYFPSILTREESDQMVTRMRTKIKETGWGLWAVSVPGVAEFIGFIGLAKPTFDAHFTPAVEIGWRLAYPFWGKGYATEGALACLRYGFETLNLEEIVSFTAIKNMRSRAVMERIRMHYDSKDNFDHPKLSEGHPLSRHVLYRISQHEWYRDTHLQVRLMSSEKQKKEVLDFRQRQFFDRLKIQDPYRFALDQKNHLHWLLYDRNKVVGYAHVQIWPDHRAALRIIVIDEQVRSHGMGKYLMDYCERTLKEQGITLLQTEASPNAYLFYKKLGYIEMPFNNPEGSLLIQMIGGMGKYL